MKTTYNHSIEHNLYVNSFYTTFQEHKCYVAVETLLLMGMIWMILKKKKPKPIINLTRAEEEDLISQYSPEELVSEVSMTHTALNQNVLQGKIGIRVVIDGSERFNFASHDYLGFIGHTKIENEAKECVSVYGVGSCGPRAFYGTTLLHLQLEQQLAQFLQTEDSILFSYGFATIASTIPAYTKKNDIVFVDNKCNYAIQQGLRASKSNIKYFKHNDVQNLHNILEETRNLDLLNTRKACKTRRLLVVEGIYLNTGEICNLPKILKLCKMYKLRILVDESISFGVLGKSGRGITEYFGIPMKDIDLIMGSFEYSFASVGGFCAGSRFLVDHLLAAALGYMFSASLPPLLAKASLLALKEIKKHPEKLETLRKLCNCMHNKLTGSNVINTFFYVDGDKDSPVHVLTLRVHLKHDKEEEVIAAISDFCLKKCMVITQAAHLIDSDMAMTRSGLRITTNINHTEQLLSCLINVLEDACCYVFDVHHDNLLMLKNHDAFIK